ncbi:hypothetical protein CPC16_000143 [Podila verticillata]|nr:hypothetical protein CPC16_000143 [Podila verticillata]KAI9237298.1 MAG: hypothetical protein BYD32DRAFT_461706 [Podila humilis]
MAINRQVNYDGFTPQNCETFNVATPTTFSSCLYKNFRPLTSNDSDLLTEAVE